MNYEEMKTKEDDKSKDTSEEKTKLVEGAITEMEKTFGLGSVKRSRIVTRGFSLNEIVESSS